MTDSLPKAVLFDLDDTIIKHELPEVTWKRIAERYSSLLNGVTADSLLKALMEHREWYWSNAERHRSGRLNPALAAKQIVKGTLDSLSIDEPDLVSEIAEAFQTQHEQAEELYPDVVKTMKQLRRKKIRLALVTNGGRDSQRRKVDRHELEPLFDKIVIEGEYGVGKPDPRVYSHALSHLNAMPKDAWMVGVNLEWEVAAPQRLGIFSIWVDHSGEGLSEDTEIVPNRIIGSLSELL